MSRNRYKIYGNAHPHFLTCTIVEWLPVFIRPPAVQIVFDSWSFLQGQGRVKLFAYVILENHLHFIAAADDLTKEVANFKSHTARQIIDLLQAGNAKYLLKQLAFFKRKHKTDRLYQLWQEGSHLEQITSDEMKEQEIEYIHNNPVKHGYVDEPAYWRYSSARNYAGLPGLIDVT